MELKKFINSMLNRKKKCCGARYRERLMFGWSKSVRAFAEASASKSLPKTPQKLGKKEIKFVCKMVNEELDELKVAKKIGEQADALVDAIYFILDASAKHGINLDPIFNIVHDNNMTKIENKKTIRDKEGKVQKPANFVRPDKLIREEIKKQKENGSF